MLQQPPKTDTILDGWLERLVEDINPINTFYPGSNVTDHGVATASKNSIKDYVDAIGTSLKATLVLKHNSSGNTTTYTLTTSETIPSNITLIIEDGAILDGAGTLTLDNPQQIDALPNQQIFGSSITISFTNGGTAHLGWWGGKGDSNHIAASLVTDNLTFFNKAIAACSVGGEVVLTSGDWYSSGSVVVPKGITLRGIGRCYIIGYVDGGYLLDFDGYQAADNLVGWQSGASRTMFGLDNIGLICTTPHTEGGHGIRVRNSYYGSFKLPAVRYFEKGIKVDSTVGRSSYYNNFYLNDIMDCRYGVEVYGAGNQNANNFYSGHIHYSSTHVWGASTCCATYVRDAASNFFHGTNLEMPSDSRYLFLYANNAAANCFMFNHLEGGATTKFNFTADVINNIFILPYTNLKYTEILNGANDNVWISSQILSTTKTDTITISSAEIKDLVGTPKVLVAAKGAGTLIEFVSAVLFLDIIGGVLAEPSAPDDLAIEYDGGTQIATWDTTGFITSNADAMEIVKPQSLGGGAATIGAATNANKHIVLKNTGGDYTGATSTSTMIVKVTYKVHYTGL